MAKEIILSKESSESEIKSYFNAILELSKSDNEFPVNLEEVWMLVYERKDSAVKALVRDFVENEDYKLLRRKVEQVSGAKYIDDYYLTLPCLEYFIVKKVRPVFEVYRKVFHRTVQKAIEEKNPTQPTISDKMKAATWAAKFLNLDEHSKLIMAKAILDPIGLPTKDFSEDESLLPITTLLKKKGVAMSGKAANKKLLELGLLEKLSRYSRSRGKDVPQWVITEKGKKFGKMHQHKDASFPSPVWFVDKSNELVSLLGISSIG